MIASTSLRTILFIALAFVNAAKSDTTGVCQISLINFRLLCRVRVILTVILITENYRQILFTDNRQEILKYTDEIPTSTIYRQIPTTRRTVQQIPEIWKCANITPIYKKR